jgi:hypothetical protein
VSLFRNVEADVRAAQGNLRPAWLADDQAWRDQLDALGPDDVRWFEAQWELAGGAPPGLDMSWLTFDTI